MHSGAMPWFCLCWMDATQAHVHMTTDAPYLALWPGRRARRLVGMWFQLLAELIVLENTRRLIC